LIQAVEERVSDRRVLKLLRAMLGAGVMEDGRVEHPLTGTAQGGLCSAEHNDPYAQCGVMRSAGLAGLVDAGSAGERCA
jgi:RNA-directed DNA polymerase